MTNQPAAYDYEADAGLVARIQAQEPGADAEFVAQFERSIRWNILGRTKSHAALDDLVNDTLLILILQLRAGDLRDGHKLVGYVQTIAKRVAFGWIGDRIRERNKRVGLDDICPPADPGPSPERRFAVLERNELLKQSIAQLNPHQREILDRFYFLGQPIDQIMAEMDLTSTQFRLHKHRAKAALFAIVHPITHKSPELIEIISPN